MAAALKRTFNIQREKCRELFDEYNESQSCPPNYDALDCWPTTTNGSMALLPCPLSSQSNRTMSRWCVANITRSDNDNTSALLEWSTTDDSACKLDVVAANFIHPFPLGSVLDDEASDLYWWHMQLYSVIRCGYVISIISLFVALFMFSSFPRLLFTRVRIHINLFISMVVQAIMWVTQSMLFGHQIFLSLITEDVLSGDLPSLWCRALMVIGNYFKLTSFSWTLMESWYFYNFICRSPYEDFTKIKPLVIFGWGAPVIVIITYVIVYSLATETNFCWVDVDVKSNLLAVPVFVMVLISFCFFVANVRVLFIKLNCTTFPQRKKHFWKWLKSTLMLVPLFGAHDLFFSIEPWIEHKQTKIHFYNVLRVVCSLHGFIVSTLHCFLNKEVQAEIQRTWKTWNSKREINLKAIKRRYKGTPKKSAGQMCNTEISSLSTGPPI